MAICTKTKTDAAKKGTLFQPRNTRNSVFKTQHFSSQTIQIESCFSKEIAYGKRQYGILFCCSQQFVLLCFDFESPEWTVTMSAVIKQGVQIRYHKEYYLDEEGFKVLFLRTYVDD